MRIIFVPLKTERAKNTGGNGGRGGVSQLIIRECAGAVEILPFSCTRIVRAIITLSLFSFFSDFLW